MRILFLSNVPSPYRVDFFNELGKYVNLTVIFEKGSSDERDEAWKNYAFKNFEGIILNGISLNTDTALCLSIVKYLKKGLYDYIICTNVASPTGMLAIQYMKLRGISFVIESDGGFAKNGKGFKEKIKKYFISKADSWLSTSEELDKYFLMYGAKRENIFRYPFSSVSENEILERPVLKEEKQKIREKLGMNEKKIILSVGQFIPRKGFDVLLESARLIDDDVGVYIIGGKVTEEYNYIIEKYGLKNIHFVEFMLKDKLRNYFMAADLFVLPTREDIWGLVVNEAMAYGLPVITTKKCVAGLEMVKDKINGHLVEIENVLQLSSAINLLLNELDVYVLGSNAIKTVKQYTIEQMVQSHIEFFKKNK